LCKKSVYIACVENTRIMVAYYRLFSMKIVIGSPERLSGLFLPLEHQLPTHLSLRARHLLEPRKTRIPLHIKVLLLIAPTFPGGMHVALGTMMEWHMVVPNILEEMNLVFPRE